jgi:hypothetical protein
MYLDIFSFSDALGRLYCKADPFDASTRAQASASCDAGKKWGSGNPIANDKTSGLAAAVSAD